MTKIILTTDQTLMSEFRNIPLGSFLGCAPVERVPEFIFNFIAPSTKNIKGIAKYAPYGLRKVEAALLKKFKREDVIVAHPDHVNRFIDKDTEIVGIYTMDPFGFGPVSLMFTYGGSLTSYTAKRFWNLIKTLPKGYKYKIVVGGPGAWQLEIEKEKILNSKIDHVVMGETDSTICDIFEKIISSSLDVFHKIKQFPSVEEIPTIVNGSMNGLVEVMRGCGRGCSFCEPNMRKARFMPLDKIEDEIKVNIKNGMKSAWIESDDIFLYRLEDKSNFTPNREAITELFKMIMDVKGLNHSNPTHGSLAPAVADPEMIKELSSILKAGPDNWIGIQPGLETGSVKILTRYMRNKIKPFKPEEWTEVVLNSVKIFNENYWYPAMTLIVGMDIETDEDAWDTVNLINEMEKLPNSYFTLAPLAFVPLGVLRNRNFFTAEKMLTEARYSVIYRCWRHNLMEINRNLWKFNKTPIHIKSIIEAISRASAKVILKEIEKYGKRMGFDHKKAFKYN